MTSKHIIAIVVAFVVATAIYGAYLYPQALVAVGSPAGSTFNSAKVAAINITPSTASATSSSITNGDASDRFITDAFVTCANVIRVGAPVTGSLVTGTDAWHWYMATTTTANASTVSLPAIVATASSANFAANFILSTSTLADGYIATSTYTQVYNQRWAAGTALVIQPNATSTAACNAGVHYLAL